MNTRYGQSDKIWTCDFLLPKPKKYVFWTPLFTYSPYIPLKRIVLHKWNRREQGVGRAEPAQATDNDYATVERSWNEYTSLAEASIFEYAFKLGAKLMLETIE